MNIDLNVIFEYVSHFVFWASVLNALLPPFEMFDGFPRFQKYYKLAVKIVNNYAALNVRKQVAEAYVAYRDKAKDGTAKDN